MNPKELLQNAAHLLAEYTEEPMVVATPQGTVLRRRLSIHSRTDDALLLRWRPRAGSDHLGVWSGELPDGTRRRGLAHRRQDGRVEFMMVTDPDRGDGSLAERGALDVVVRPLAGSTRTEVLIDLLLTDHFSKEEIGHLVRELPR